MKRITIKDLAKLLNLSTSTVSRALSDHPDISDATKSRVRKVAEEFNYRRNLHAQLFRKNRSGLIALILPEANMFYSPGLIKGINKTIEASKYTLIVFLSNDSYAKEQEIIKQCLNWAVEGVLISLSKDTRSLDHLMPLKKAGIKCVLYDKIIENDEFPTVTIDNTLASENAVSYLINKGHQHILGLFDNPNLSISQERIKGFVKAMEDNNVKVETENIISVNKSSDLDYILPPILKHNHQISAIFTMTDELLAKSHYHISAIGLSIPDSIAIVSISDGIYPYLTHPKITHIKDSGSKMGRTACQLLIKCINEPEEALPKALIVSTKLVKLESA